MKSVTREFARKIAREGGILDTRNYRYALCWDDDTVERIRIECLGTTAVLRENGNWETLTIK